nr:ABC transporter ATP-binding protein [Micrococcus cohnii]
MLRILRFAPQLNPLYLGIAASAVLAALLALATPFIIGAATDRIVDAVAGRTSVSDAVTSVVWLALAFLAAEVAATAVVSVGGYWGDVMAARMRRILSSRYYDHLLHLPQRYFDTTLTGRIVSRLNRSITELTQFLQFFSNNAFTMLITTAAVLVISAFYWWPLAVLLAVVFPVYMWLTAKTSTRWQVWEGQKNARVDTASGRFAEVVAQMPVVRAYNQQRTELVGFEERFDEAVALTREQSRFWHMMDAWRRLALNAVFGALYLLIFIRTAQGEFSVGDMVILIQLMAMARQPVMSMSYLVDSAQRAVAGSKDYFEVLEQPRERTDGRALPAGAGEPAVRFRDVTFAYDADAERPVLDGVSFDVHAGRKIAFVGESGGGKSTVTNLLMGLYPAGAGAVEVFGQDVAQTDLAALRALIATVFQEPHLFSGTVRENIAYARPDATDAEVRAAAKAAYADGFIEAFDDGYDQVIGERGLRLSGGQKQRIAVARAVLKDAPILVLDEATSALDTKSERLVQAALEDLMVGRTSLIVAHRLSTIRSVDTIVTLRGGRVEEIGAPDELAESGGIYAQLLQLQQAGTKEAKKMLREYGILG